MRSPLAEQLVALARVRRAGVRGLAVLLVFTTGCTAMRTNWRATFHPASQPPPPPTADEPFLAAHMPSGDLYVLGHWQLTPGELLHGTGLLYDPHRQLRARGTFDVPLSSIALFETLDAEMIEVETQSAGKIAAIVVVSALGAILGLVVVAFLLSPPGT